MHLEQRPVSGTDDLNFICCLYPSVLQLLHKELLNDLFKRSPRALPVLQLVVVTKTHRFLQVKLSLDQIALVVYLLVVWLFVVVRGSCQ